MEEKPESQYCKEHGKMAYLKEWGKYSHLKAVDGSGKKSYCNKSLEELEGKIVREPAENTAPGWVDHSAERSYRIERQHSQSVAVADLFNRGITSYSDEQLKERIDWFMKDLDREP